MSKLKTHVNIGPWLPSHTLCGTTADPAHLVSIYDAHMLKHKENNLCQKCLKQMRVGV
jgi:hypothetical protein